MERNAGLTADPLYLGLTRPTTIWGVTYTAMLINMVTTAEVFILTGNLAWLLAFFPVHLLLYGVCQYEPRFFDLGLLWARTRLPASIVGNFGHWRSGSYSPLALDLPNARGKRRLTRVSLRT